MSVSGRNGTDQDPVPPDPNGVPWPWRFGVTLGLLLGFAVLVGVMMWLAGGDDTAWERRQYVFISVQAIVFAAVGWLFARQVQRTELRTVHGDAAAARAEALVQTERAAEARQRAAAAEARAEAVRAALRSAAGPGGPTGSGPSAEPTGPQVDLRTFLDQLYPG